jgi:hypothetical protein
MLISSNPPSAPLWLDLSFDIGSLTVVGISVEPLHVSEDSIVTRGILSVVVVS